MRLNARSKTSYQNFCIYKVVQAYRVHLPSMKRPQPTISDSPTCLGLVTSVSGTCENKQWIWTHCPYAIWVSGLRSSWLVAQGICITHLQITLGNSWDTYICWNSGSVIQFGKMAYTPTPNHVFTRVILWLKALPAHFYPSSSTAMLWSSVARKQILTSVFLHTSH